MLESLFNRLRLFWQIVQTKNAWQLYLFLTRIAVDKNMLWSKVKDLKGQTEVN
jgi:hypothetical protein